MFCDIKTVYHLDIIHQVFLVLIAEQVCLRAGVKVFCPLCVNIIIMLPLLMITTKALSFLFECVKQGSKQASGFLKASLMEVFMRSLQITWQCVLPVHPHCGL